MNEQIIVIIMIGRESVCLNIVHVMHYCKMLITLTTLDCIDFLNVLTPGFTKTINVKVVHEL